MKKILVSLLFGLMCVLGAHVAKAQGIALRTNLVDWALEAPNIGVDFVLNQNTTLNISVAATVEENYIHDAFVQQGQLEYRYWFSAQPYENFFLGLQFSPTHYRLRLDKRSEGKYKNTDHTHSGVAFPFGFNFGYSWPLNSKLNIEACYGAGWIYYNNECSLGRTPSHNMTFTTTNLGLNITYILK